MGKERKMSRLSYDLHLDCVSVYVYLMNYWPAMGKVPPIRPLFCSFFQFHSDVYRVRMGKARGIWDQSLELVS